MMTRRRAVVSVGVALCLALLGALWVTSDSWAAQRAHRAAWAKWQSKEPPAYSFDYAYCGGMCANCLLHVSVEHGKVVDAVTREGQCSTSEDNAPTVDDVFAMEKGDRSSGRTASFEIRYDPTWGFPASVSIRCPDGWMDCGKGYSITHFLAAPVDPDASRS
jgi:hypothetical protein